MRSWSDMGILGNVAPKVRPKFRAGQRPVSQGTGVLRAGATIGSVHQVPSSSVALRFELANLSRDADAVYLACFAISSHYGGLTSPSRFVDDESDPRWVAVTQGGNREIVVPAAECDLAPARAMSDEILLPHSFRSRLDGGNGICIYYRQYCVSGTPTIGNFDTTVGEWAGHRNGLKPAQFVEAFGGGWVADGNYCVNEFAEAEKHAVEANVFAPHSIQVISSKRIITVASVGDSILSGIASRGALDHGINCVGHQLARKISAVGPQATHMNLALSGASNERYIKDARIAFGQFVPDLFLMSTYSPNGDDTVTRESVWNQFQRSMSFLSWAVDQGSTPILIATPPYCGPGSPRKPEVWEEARLYANRLISGSCHLQADIGQVVGDPSNASRYRYGFSDDFIHLNSLASEVLAEKIVQTLKCHTIR